VGSRRGSLLAGVRPAARIVSGRRGYASARVEKYSAQCTSKRAGGRL
jgi:hypothetical protein